MVASIFDWSVTAADNDDADTDINWLEGQQGSTVNNSARAMMAKVAAVVKMMRGAYTTTNTGDAYVLAVDFPPASLAKGWFGIVRFNAGNTGAATLEMTPLAATTLRDAEGTALASGAIVANALYLVVYDTTASQYRIVSKVSTTLTSANISDFTEAVQDVVGALTGFGGTGLTFSYNDGAGTLSLSVELSELSAEATIATDDYLAIVDTSETSASNKMLVSDFLKVVNALTEDATPDTSNDFLLSYDASTGTAKKVKPINIATSVTAASAAEQEAGSEAAKYVAPATQHRHVSAAKFWVKATANSTTILVSYNMTSWADTGLGVATGTIATDFSGAEWAGLVSADGGNGITQSSVIQSFTFARALFTAGTFVVWGWHATGTGPTYSAQDPSTWHVAGWGDQA